MINQYTKLDNPLSFLDIGLWLTAIIITSVIGIYTLIKYYSKRSESETKKLENENILTWALFMILMSAGSICQLLWRFVFPVTSYYVFSPFVFAILISIILVDVAILIKIINIERGMNRLKFFKGYYFTIIMLISIIYVIIYYPFIREEIGILHIIYMLLAIVGFCVFPGIFLYLAIKTTGDARIKAVEVVIGAIFIGGSLLFQPQNAATYLIGNPNYHFWMIFFLIICPIWMILGILLIYNSYRSTL